MGASEWCYVEPYDPDLPSVLTSLHEREFTEGNYYYLPGEDGWPSTMAELFADECVQEEGTHSILDIFRVIGPGEADDYGTLRPLRQDEVTRYFGSETPDQAAFERARQNREPGGLQRSGRRWSGYCTPLYEHGVPAQLVIWGFSGD